VLEEHVGVVGAVGGGLGQHPAGDGRIDPELVEPAQGGGQGHRDSIRGP
jgi:hypothetical protein